MGTCMCRLNQINQMNQIKVKYRFRDPRMGKSAMPASLPTSVPGNPSAYRHLTQLVSPVSRVIGGYMGKRHFITVKEYPSPAYRGLPHCNHWACQKAVRLPPAKAALAAVWLWWIGVLPGWGRVRPKPRPFSLNNLALLTRNDADDPSLSVLDASEILECPPRH
jgi:hypothetical protein